MAHIHTKIREAVWNRLKPLGIPCRRTPLVPEEGDSLPVIHISTPGESVDTMEETGGSIQTTGAARQILSRTVELTIDLFVKGTIKSTGEHDMDAELDELFAKVEQRLLSDPSLGGAVRSFRLTGATKYQPTLLGDVPCLGLTTTWQTVVHTQGGQPDRALHQHR